MNVQLGDWQYLEKIFPKTDLNQEAVDWLDLYQGPLSVACSGGPDSLVLLLLVRLYWPKNRCFLFYYNHRIRKQADSEEIYLKQLADSLGISFVAGHCNEAIRKTETDLRKVRYAFFEKNLRLYDSHALLLGQHEDDCIETVLMRLFRGSSLDGIVAPRAVHHLKSYTKIRPLLTLSKTDLQAACERCGIHYFIDHTNFEDMCIRNRLRKHVLPQLDNVFKTTNWRKGFRQTCAHLIEQHTFLTYHAKKCLESINFSTHFLDKKIFSKKSIWEQHLIVRQWLHVQCSIDLSFEQLDSICSALIGAEKKIIVLDKNHSIILQNDGIRLKKLAVVNDSVFSFKWLHGSIFFPNGAQLSRYYMPLNPELYKITRSGFYKDTEIVVLDNAQIERFCVRNWIHGDRYQPIGFIHEKKVKCLFSARKIQTELRKQLPVITDGVGKILWIPGLPPAETIKIKPTTKLCVFLVYKKK